MSPFLILGLLGLGFFAVSLDSEGSDIAEAEPETEDFSDLDEVQTPAVLDAQEEPETPSEPEEEEAEPTDAEDPADPEEPTDPTDPEEPADAEPPASAADDALSTDGDDTLNGGAGNDTLSATAEAAGAVLNGGEGSDNITLLGLSNTANGGEGDDVIGFGNLVTDTENTTVANGGLGDDTINPGGIGGTANGGEGDDLITAQGSFPGLNGDAGNDTIRADTSDYGGASTLNGGADDDLLFAVDGAGESFVQTLNGDAGDDILASLTLLDAEGVVDVLTGGEGNDVFQVGLWDDAALLDPPPFDVGTVIEITDFNPEEDALVIDPRIIDNTGFLDANSENYELTFELEEDASGTQVNFVATNAFSTDATLSGTFQLDGVTGLEAAELDISVGPISDGTST